MYQSLLAALPYPEWRIKLVNHARKAGLGDIGKVVAHVFCSDTEDLLPRASQTMVDQPMVIPNAVGQEEVAERGSTGRTRSDTIGLTKDVAIQGAYDSSTLLEIGEESDDDKLELSDCEWMRDLDWQGRTERSRTDKEASRGAQTASSAVMPSPAPPPSNHSLA